MNVATSVIPARWQTSLFLPIVGGLILSLAYPRFDFWPLAWIAIVPLWIFIDSAPNRWMALLGTFLFSFTFFAISIHWLRFVTLFGWAFVVCLETFFFTVMGFLAWIILHRRPCKVCFFDNISLLFILPALWVLAEWGRSEIPVLGFGWNLLSFSQTEYLNLIQFAKLTGAYGVSFLVALGNAFFFLLWRLMTAYGSPLRRFLILGAAFAIVIGIFVGTTRYGIATLAQPVDKGTALRVSMIQGDIAQEEKWDPKYRNVILQKYLKLTELASYDGPDLIVWPEAAYPGYYNLDREGFLAQAVDKSNIHLIFGALTALSDKLFYNSAYLLSGEGQVLSRYDKMRLVPFGEYMPFHSVLFPLDGLAQKMGVSDFSEGDESKLFHIPLKTGEASIGPLICFENTLQDFVRKLAWKGADVLCVITNDAWFRESSAPYQHLDASIFRAIETGRWVIHCANTGVTAFVSPKGEVTDRVKDPKGHELFVMGGITRPVYLSRESTPYLQFGYLFPYIALLIVLQGLLLSKKK
ncbi:MAG: apolipoprotein N-acyltransferase [Candidatus Omnitrophica bacterium]|nr:apolipoprotein N-acyltransferase [Candidatus Omnitrophota bacterium]